jgi:hypothetical protein
MPDIHGARSAMEKFVNMLSSLRKMTADLPFAPSLRIDHSFLYAPLGPNYNVAQWREDTDVDPTIRGLFKSLAARGPYLRGLPTEITDEFPVVYQYSISGQPCVGLGYAHLLSGFAVSLATDEAWNSPSLTITAEFLVEDSESQFSVVIPHASHSEHVRQNEEILRDRVSEHVKPIKDLADLWENRERLFPHLLFASDVEDQLHRLDYRRQLPGIRSSLAAYNEYATRWAKTNDDFSHTEMPHVTPESASRIDKFRDEMTFEWNGRNQIFRFHGRFTPGAGRIYMEPDPVSRKLVIGYIGEKIGK